MISRNFRQQTIAWLASWPVVFVLAWAEPAWSGVLTLEDAESLAIASDPAIRKKQASGSALSELAMAAAQLPDPLLKVGVMGLPTDSFNLGQEAMTQVQLGVVQKFPRGQSRSLRSEQIRERSLAIEESVRDQRLRIVLAVRQDYLEVLKHRKLAAINEAAINTFTDLADITQDYYATGRVQQQDVLRAAVELAKVQDRTTRILQEEDRARARLAAWIGAAAYRQISNDWPQIGPVSSLEELQSGLASHPRILALHRNVIAAETGVDLAQQNYKPEFALDLTYGGRGGIGPDGRDRSDLLSLMLVMDLPLFHANRQDRISAARIAESSAAMFHRDDVFRQMQSEIAVQAATLSREQERISLFKDSLLPDAGFNAEATFEAYQAAVEDLTTLMRARITEFELQLEYAKLQAELLLTQARLLYFEGDSG